MQDTYTGKIVEEDVEIQTYRGETLAKRWVLDSGTQGRRVIENIFNKYKNQGITIIIKTN